MRIEHRQHIKYNRLGGIVAYTGPMGCGKTLAAIVHLVKISGSPNPPKVLSNLKLNGIDYQPLRLETLMDCTGNLIFLDMAEFTIGSRSSMSKVNTLFSYFCSRLRHANNRVILTVQDLKHIDQRVRDMVSAEIRCSYRLNSRGTPYLQLARVYRNLLACYPPFRVRKYFKNYDTTAIPENFLKVYGAKAK